MKTIAFVLSIGLYLSTAASANAAVVVVSNSCPGSTSRCITDVLGVVISGVAYDVDFQFDTFDDLNALGKFPEFGDRSWAETAAQAIVDVLNVNSVPNKVTSDDGIGVNSTTFDIPFEFDPIFQDPTVKAVVSAGFTSAPAFNNWQVSGCCHETHAATGDIIFATFSLSDEQPTSVPEPITFSLLGFGLVGLWRPRRTR